MIETTENQFCKELIKGNRLFTILSEKLTYSNHYDSVLYGELIKYINHYIGFHSLSKEEVATSYLKYIKQYNKDVRNFSVTNKYPLFLEKKVTHPSRIDYSVVLLLSTIFTEHRFRIMQLIKNVTRVSLNGLFIGIGPGLELFLLQSKIKNVTAFDLTLDDFLFDFYDSSKFSFKNEYFDGTGKERYDSIFLIELLEHIKDPYELLMNCVNVLSPGGRIYLTTATNIPQFDHLYNFSAAHINFEDKVKELGLTIEFMEDIPHGFITKGVDSKNRYYILKK